MPSHEVTLTWNADRARTVRVEPTETVVEAAERSDLGLPYGCLTGACGTCTGRLVRAAGTDSVTDAFEYRRPPRALKDRHETDGYVLLCIAMPRTDCTVAVGVDVRTGLVENPWK